MESATLLVFAALAVVLFIVIRKALASSPFQGRGATVIAVCVAILCVIAMGRFLGIGSTSSPSSAATAPPTQPKDDGLGFLLIPYAALAISICFLVLLVAAWKVLKRRSIASNHGRGPQSQKEAECRGQVGPARELPIQNDHCGAWQGYREPVLPPSARLAPAPGPTPAMVSGKLWSCYMLVDCSQQASDVAPVIGRGLSSIIRSLKNAASLVPAISVTPLRESFSGITAPCRIDQVQVMNLSCQGSLKLRQPVEEVIKAIERHAAAGEPKPLVVVVLASHPADDALPVMSQLSELCARGKVNVVAVAMGAGASDAPLVRPGGICLRVDDPYGNAGDECFAWIGKMVESILAALGGSAAGKAMNLPPLRQGVRLIR